MTSSSYRSLARTISRAERMTWITLFMVTSPVNCSLLVSAQFRRFWKFAKYSSEIVLMKQMILCAY